MPNQVTLTFAGEEKPLVDSMERVGGASQRLGDEVGGTSKKLDEHANGLEKVGSSADNAERNIIGVHDVIDGTATIMQGPGKQGIVAYLQGWADLAGGIAPMAEYLAQTRIGTLAQAAAQKVAAVGAKAWAGAQWLMNSALLASPITWIIVGIVALIAVIVLIATKTDWFQRAWRASWGWIRKAAADTWNFIKQIPGWIGNAFSRVASAISGPFRSAFNYVARAWNNTIGRLSWSVPSWVPIIGGNSISVPNLPTFHAGGTVPGGPGRTVVAALQGGEKVMSAASADGGGQPIRISENTLAGVLVRTIRDAVSSQGGDPDVLGIVLV